MHCPKQFSDDGSEVRVDLHGCTVDDALYVVRRTVQEACRRGRSRVVVIHGRSRPDRIRTIRSELMRRLDRGDYGEWVTSHLQGAGGGQSTLYMPIGNANQPARIRERDVIRPGR